MKSDITRFVVENSIKDVSAKTYRNVEIRETILTCS